MNRTFKRFHDGFEIITRRLSLFSANLITGLAFFFLKPPLYVRCQRCSVYIRNPLSTDVRFAKLIITLLTITAGIRMHGRVTRRQNEGVGVRKHCFLSLCVHTYIGHTTVEISSAYVLVRMYRVHLDKHFFTHEYDNT